MTASFSSVLFWSLMLNVVVSSCGSKDGTSARNPTETTVDVTTPSPRPVEKDEPVGADEINRNPMDFTGFTAGGSEPGWSLKAQKSGPDIRYQLTLAYGEVNLSGDDGELQTETGTLVLNTDQGMITPVVLRQPCRDLAGNTHDADVRFSFNGDKYVGCGDFVDQVNF